MPDDERNFTGGEDPPPDNPLYGEAGPADEEVPASLIFMEMMRRAAAQSSTPPPDVLPNLDLSKFARGAPSPAQDQAPDAESSDDKPAASQPAAAKSRPPSDPPVAEDEVHPETNAQRSRRERLAAQREKQRQEMRDARRAERRARMAAANGETDQSADSRSGQPAPEKRPPRERPKRERTLTEPAPPAASSASPPIAPAEVPNTADEIKTADEDSAPVAPRPRGVWVSPTSWREALEEVEAIPTPPSAPQTATPSQPAEAAQTAAREAESSESEERDQREIQRVQRVQRRRRKRRRQAVSTIGGVVRAVLLIGVSAIIIATIFTWVTSPNLLATNVRQNLSIAAATATSGAAPVASTPLITPAWARRVGIVSGHWGPENDPGAVCADGLTEASINRDVAQRVVILLRGRGYQVDLLDEFDPRLNNYQATLLLSIHTNDCRDYGEFVSGYLIAKAAARPDGGEDGRLVECVALYYEQATGLQRRIGLTVDMTDYHTFREIHPLTPAAILELGFMKDDREILTNQRDLLAQGIADGLICFLEGTILPASSGTPENPPTLLPTPGA